MQLGITVPFKHMGQQGFPDILQLPQDLKHVVVNKSLAPAGLDPSELRLTLSPTLDFSLKNLFFKGLIHGFIVCVDVFAEAKCISLRKSPTHERFSC